MKRASRRKLAVARGSVSPKRVIAGQEDLERTNPDNADEVTIP
jgi:hypothetical protein